MSEKGTGRPKATAILAGCASLVTIFTWIGITPAAVGQSVYDALCIAWPFLVAGLAFLAGWNLKKIWVSRELDKRAARIAKLEKSATDAAGRIAELENQARDRDSALESATRKNGAIERELDDLRKMAHRIIAEKDKALHRMVEAEAEREELKARLAEYEDIEAREAERRRRHLDGIAAEIKDLHANVKLVILALYDEGPIRDLHFHDFGGAASFLSDYADGEEIPPGNVIFTLKPETREALDAHPEALARVRERIEDDPRLRLPLEPDDSPGMEGVLKVSDGYAASRPDTSTAAVPENGAIRPARK